MPEKTLTGKGKGIEYKDLLETFTPERAIKLLEGAESINTHNRPVSTAAVNKYASDMKGGHWGECPQPIVISEEGILLDGQTRLWAIVESGTTQKFPVVYGASMESQKFIDRGRSRKFSETLGLFGLTACNPKHVAVTTMRMFKGNVSIHQNLSHAELEPFFLRHKEAIEFAAGLFPKPVYRVSTGPVMGAIARGWYYIDDKNGIKRFADILDSGVSNGSEEVAAIRLRDWLRSPDYKGGETAANLTYLKTQAALRAFIRKSPLSKMQAAQDDLFPLPEVDPGTGIRNGLTNHKAAWFRKHFGGRD